MINTETLRKIGLSDAEIKAYLALLELGQTTTGPIVKKSGIPSSKIYHLLGSLSDKGLVGHIVHGKVKKFRANNPVILRHVLDLREKETNELREQLEQTIPSLENLFTSDKSEHKIEIFEGLRGIKSIYDFTLKVCGKGEILYTVGYPLLASQLLHAYFKDYHKRMAKKGLGGKILYDYDTWFAKKREARPHSEQKYLPKGIHTPAFIHIFDEYVAIMVVTEQQKISILIKNDKVAKSYRQYFDLLWKLGKKAE